MRAGEGVVDPSAWCEVCGSPLAWCPIWARQFPWLPDWRDWA